MAMKRTSIVLLLVLVLCLSACARLPERTGDFPSDSVQIETDIGTNNSSDAPTEPSTEPTVNKKDGPMGGTGDMCMVHANPYHYFPKGLIEYIGRDRFYQWINDTEYAQTENGCTYPEQNFYACIHYFNVSREALEEIYYTECYYNGVIDFNLMYGDDADAVDAFYRNTDDLNEIISKRTWLSNLKFKIFQNHESKWNQAYGEFNTGWYSLSDIVTALDIPRDELERYVTELNEYAGATYPYNFDLIYNNSGKAKAPAKGNDPHPVMAQDALICGVENYEIG